MEYRIFGREREPSDEFRSQLQAFCDLDETQREALAGWFESTADFNPYSPELPLVVRASTLLPDQFRKTAAPIRFLLESWQRRSLELADIERDLLLLGFDLAQLEKVSGFLSRVSHVRERVWLDALEGNAQVVGLPTMDDANLVWSARPIFGGSSYYYFDSDEDAATYAKCFGLTCVAILEFMVSDSNGTKQRMAIQVNEDMFRVFSRAVDRAEDQLKSLKTVIESVASYPGKR